MACLITLLVHIWHGAEAMQEEGGEDMQEDGGERLKDLLILKSTLMGGNDSFEYIVHIWLVLVGNCSGNCSEYTVHIWHVSLHCLSTFGILVLNG